MVSRLVAGADDPIRPAQPESLTVIVDGEERSGLRGQTLAGLMMSDGRLAWRSTPAGEARGVFCGIGVCFDCLVVVNGQRDVRACQRRANDGDVIQFQHDSLPGADS
jgi:hypothetical protein